MLDMLHTSIEHYINQPVALTDCLYAVYEIASLRSQWPSSSLRGSVSDRGNLLGRRRYPPPGPSLRSGM